MTPSRRWRGSAVMVGLLAVAVAATVLVAHNRRPAPEAVSVAASAAKTTSRSAAPSGYFTISNGSEENVSSFRGHSVLVWFVAGGCASCAASIPAVAQHLSQLRRAT